MAKKYIIYVCWSMMSVLAMSMTVISPLLLEISEFFAVSLSKAGLFFSFNFIGFISFVFVGGIIADHRGKINVLKFCNLGITLSLLLFPLSPTYIMALLVIFFMGGFRGVINSTINALMVEVNPDDSSFYLNMTHAFFGIGAILGPVMAGIIVYTGLSWRYPYLVIGLFSLLISLLFLQMKFPELETSSSITWPELKSLLGRRKMIFIALALMFYTGSEVGSWGWISTFLEQEMGFSIVFSGLAVGVFWFFMTVGRLICARLSRRYSIQKLIILLACMAMAINLFTGLVGEGFLIWVLMAAMGLAFSGLWPLIASYASELFTDYSGTLFSVLVTSGGLGTVFIPFFMGLMGEQIGLRLAMVVPSLFFLLIVIIFSKL